MANMSTKRLARIADDLVREAQTCAVLSKTIQDNIHLIRYALEEFNSKAGKGGEVVHLDPPPPMLSVGVDHRYAVLVLAQFGLDLGFLR